MADLIDRQAAIDALGEMVMNWTDSEYELGQLNQWKADRKAIIDLPSEQSEIIRCRDCKHYHYADSRIPQEQMCTCEIDGNIWSPDSYCSFAEREEDE